MRVNIPRTWKGRLGRYRLAQAALFGLGVSPADRAKSEAQMAAIRAKVREQLGLTPVTLHVGAGADGEYEGPRHAVIELTPEFLTRVETLAALAKAHGLCEAGVWFAPDWAGEWSVDADRLLVTDSDWRVEASHKHVGIGIWTQAQTLDDTYIAALRGLLRGEVVELDCGDEENEE